MVVAIISGGRDPSEVSGLVAQSHVFERGKVALSLGDWLLSVSWSVFFSGGVLGACCIHTDRCAAVRRQEAHVDTKHNLTYIISTMCVGNGPYFINWNET